MNTFSPGDIVRHEHIATELTVIRHDEHDPGLVVCEVGGQKIAVPAGNITLVKSAVQATGRKLLT